MNLGTSLVPLGSYRQKMWGTGLLSQEGPHPPLQVFSWPLILRFLVTSLQRESNAKCGRVGFVSLKRLKLLWHCGILWLIYMCPHGTPHEDRACVPSVWHRAGRKIDPPPRFVAGRRELPNAVCRAWFEHVCVQTHVCSLVRWLTYRLKEVSSTSQMFPIRASS